MTADTRTPTLPVCFRCQIPVVFEEVMPCALEDGRVVDDLSVWIVGGLGAAGAIAGWQVVRRRHRVEMGRLRTSNDKKISTMLGRLADSRMQIVALKQEILMLKQEIVQQQNRLRRAAVQRPVPVETDPARACIGSEQVPRVDNPSGFPDTQPWEYGSP